MEKLLVVILISTALISAIARKQAQPQPQIYFVMPPQGEEPSGSIILRVIIVVMVMIIIGGIAMI